MPEHSAQPGRRRAVRGVAAVACAAIGVAVVAGCASRSGLAARSDKSPDGAIQFAAAQVVASKSVHIHGTISGGDSAGTFDGSAVLAPTLQGELTVKLDKADDMVPTHILYDGKTYYTSIPKGFHATSKAKPNAAWLGMSANDARSKKSAVLTTLQSDPAALVKELLAKGKFTQTGTGTTDGVATTHFSGDLSGGTANHVDVWLDASGLPVEIVLQPAADKQSDGRAELHFSQWGQPVTITPPPADQVLTEQDLISFAISGQQFQVSGDQLDGSTFAQSGGVAIDSGSTTPTCLPTSVPPSPGQPAQPDPITLCSLKTTVTATHN